jgi:hypothetical protein
MKFKNSHTSIFCFFMKESFVLLFSILALLSCGDSGHKNGTQTTKIVSQDSMTSFGDALMLSNSTVSSNETSFCQSDYEVILSQKDVENIDSTCLTLVKSNYAFLVSFDESSKKHDISLFEDKKDSWEKVQKDVSLEIGIQAEYPYYMFEDMDGDGVKDILIKYDQDGRQNKWWYLFLVKPNEKKFIRIDKFEEIESPEFLPKEKRIEVNGRYHGGGHTEFYKIENNKLKFIEGIDHAPDSENKYTTKTGFEN